MFARLTIVQVKKEEVDEAINFYKDSVVPAAKSQNGYRGVYLLTQPSTGRGISITLWENEEDAIANERSGYYFEQVNKFLRYFKIGPIIEGYQVSIQDE